MQLVTPLAPTAGTDDLAPVEVEDAEAFLAAYAQSEARSRIQYFPWLCLYGRSRTHQLRWERHTDSILVYQIRRRPVRWRMSLYLPPMPFNDAALKLALARMADFNGDREGRIIWVPEGEALTITRAGLSVRFREDEYILDRAAVMAHKGPEFRSLRQELSRVHNQGSVETRPYRMDDYNACTALVERWRDRLMAGGERITGHAETIACLANADRFDPSLLRGLVVEVDGVVRGFAFSGHLAGRMGCNFLCVTDTGYRGLPQLLRCRLMAEFPEHDTFNDSTDGGRPGLRDQKNRFRPVQMLGVFAAHQR